MQYLTILTLAMATQLIAFQSRASTDLNVSVEAGWSQNSALTVAELDEVSTEQDNGLMLKANLNGKWQATDKVSLQGSYSYNSQNYQDSDQYDLAMQLASLDLTYSLAWFDLGIRHDAAFASLDGDSFLDFNQTSLYLAKLINGNTFVSANTRIKTKTFALAQQRNADNIGTGLDVFYFLSSGNTMLTAGVNLEEETAADTQFNFAGFNFNTKLTHDFLVFGKDSKFSLAWRFQKRDYDAVQTNQQDYTKPLTMDEQQLTRQDNQHIYQVQWQINLLPRLALKTAVEVGDYNSNIEQQTYEQTVTSISLQAKF